MKKKSNFSTIILILAILVGLSLLLYPTVSNYWNSFHQSEAITRYADEVAVMDDSSCDQLWADALSYNATLPQKENRFLMTDEERAEYESLLNVSGSGIIGYIDIPIIGCSLPIYHGTDAGVLQIAVGHIEGSSLPTGGKGTHCVLSSHRGLPKAKLFTDLDKLTEGDDFVLRVLNETLTYEVDQIRIVLPHEIEELEIDPDKDYCTLVTCTPYGINSHRLLVRGHRVENREGSSSAHVTADAMQVKPVLVAPMLAAPILLILLLLLLIPKKTGTQAGTDPFEN